VTLTVLRQGEPDLLTFEIVRAKIETTTVAHRILEETPEIGYIRLSLFGERTADELKQAIRDLQDQGAKAFILDIRNNPGGLLRAAIDVTSQFVSDAVIVTEVWNDGREQPFNAARGGLLTNRDVPLVVLVNQGSASASEILAGAIRDLDRGTLVGDETFGKGAVQQVYTLTDKSQLNVTVAHWLTPNGEDIHKQGILPDVVITLTQEQIEASQDVQLERAIEIAQKELVRGS
jgi:carboxyl-terminal processing protease